MNPSKRDIEVFKLFYDINDGKEAEKLKLPWDWKSIDIINCTYEDKQASFRMDDIEPTFFPGEPAVYTVEIKFNNNKTRLVPFRRIVEDETIDLFTIVNSE